MHINPFRLLHGLVRPVLFCFPYIFVFGFMQGVQAVHYNLYTLPQWQAAVVDYEHRMAPAEHKIALKLREIFQNLRVCCDPFFLLFSVFLLLLFPVTLLSRFLYCFFKFIFSFCSFVICFFFPCPVSSCQCFPFYAFFAFLLLLFFFILVDFLGCFLGQGTPIFARVPAVPVAGTPPQHQS